MTDALKKLRDAEIIIVDGPFDDGPDEKGEDCAVVYGLFWGDNDGEILDRIGRTSSYEEAVNWGRDLATKFGLEFLNEADTL